jgi:hypothetical protein
VTLIFFFFLSALMIEVLIGSSHPSQVPFEFFGPFLLASGL